MRVLTEYGTGRVSQIRPNRFNDVTLDTIPKGSDSADILLASSEIIPLSSRAIVQIVRPCTLNFGLNVQDSSFGSSISSLRFVDECVDLTKIPNLFGEIVLDINLKTREEIGCNDIWFPALDMIEVVQFDFWIGRWTNVVMMLHKDILSAEISAKEFSEACTSGGMMARVLIDVKKRLLHRLYVIAPSPQGLIFSIV